MASQSAPLKNYGCAPVSCPPNSSETTRLNNAISSTTESPFVSCNRRHIQNIFHLFPVLRFTTPASRTQQRRMVQINPLGRICYIVAIQGSGRDVMQRLSRNLFGGNEQKKNTKSLSQDGPPPSRGSNRTPARYECAALSLS